ncbi:MAG: hypothetical protein AB4911_03295 [Oscillochloridaceae bacterium umkhey_bin13]
MINYFWTWFPATLLVVLVLVAAGLLWFFSPLLTGLWVGFVLNERLGREAHFLPGLVGGVLLVALAGQLPLVGWLVYAVSFLLGLGAAVIAAGQAARRPLDFSF